MNLHNNILIKDNLGKEGGPGMVIVFSVQPGKWLLICFFIALLYLIFDIKFLIIMFKGDHLILLLF
jgi:hypothetical protein